MIFPWTLLLLLSLTSALPDPGKFSFTLNSTLEYGGVSKNVYNQTKLRIRVNCHSDRGVRVGWVIRETQCWNEYAFMDRTAFPVYYANPQDALAFEGFNNASASYLRFPESYQDCNGKITLPYQENGKNSSNPIGANVKRVPGALGPDYVDYIFNHTGDYLFIIHIQGGASTSFLATVDVELEGPNGYLSVIDYPLLVFYGCMCAVYIIMGLLWLVLCSLHWRDLLRIQFWIGGVIFLGMLEKAMFLAEFSNINATGEFTPGLIFAAEIVSCAKRTLARMLVIIVSLGFGIVKPRLGQTMHRVVFVGALYFFVAAAEAYLRIVKPKNDLSGALMTAAIPLSIIDSSICWWVFSALVATTRTLRLRRNVVKLALYRHFANTLVLSVIASVVFMMWNIKFHRLEECLKDWRDLWIDEAFWHFLFSTMLCVIMFLWRPSQNNKRYAFTPLLDAEDDDMTDEDDPYYDDKVSKRLINGSNSKDKTRRDEDEEAADTLKWIEENIPESENPLPVIDSEEEIETTKFEISKMQ